jgi:RNA polymerase sigma-70 factor (ECF subfamily)
MFQDSFECFLKPAALRRSIKISGMTAAKPRKPMHAQIQQQLEAKEYDEAFDLLVEQFKEKIFRLAFSIMGNETQAQDAAQETLVRIWKGLPAYHGQASLPTWIYAVTRNTCLSELKKRNRHPTLSLDEPHMEAAAERVSALNSAQPEPGAEMDVETLLAQLAPKYRQVIVLFYLEQKAYEDISLMLGLPLGTVKTLLFRAKKELVRIGSRHPPFAVSEPALSTTNRSQSNPNRTINPMRCLAQALPQFILL